MMCTGEERRAFEGMQGKRLWKEHGFTAANSPMMNVARLHSSSVAHLLFYDVAQLS